MNPNVPLEGQQHQNDRLSAPTVKPMSARTRCLSGASTKHLSLAVDPDAVHVRLVSSGHTSGPLCATAATLADLTRTRMNSEAAWHQETLVTIWSPA